MNISNRHEGDLGGTLSPFGSGKPIGVTIRISSERAHLASTQHSAWMLVNLICRLKGIVSRISLCCPKGIALAGRIVPLAGRSADLHEALIIGGGAVGAVPIEEDIILDRTIAVGFDPEDNSSDLYVWANGWCGGISSKPFPLSYEEQRSHLPIGPYIAACLAAGEIFKEARLKDYSPSGPLFYSLWNYCVADQPILDGPKCVKAVFDSALAGVGAVGCAFLHVLWACNGLKGRIILADNDPDGLDETNLNRYAIFGRGALGLTKAKSAAELLNDSPIQWESFDGPFEDLQSIPSLVISAVDNNHARAAVQSKYRSRIFSASTSGLRAEVLRCGPPGVGACLACYNPPKPVKSDAELRELAKKLSDEELEIKAAAVNISLEDARQWIDIGKCGMVGGEILPLLRTEPGEHEFAVGFVSVLAGTMLAVEVIKEYSEASSVLSEEQPRGLFQFLSPFARTNRAYGYPRDEKCSACDPNSQATKIWKHRYESFRVK